MNEKTTILSEEGYMILPILDDLESTEWNQKQKEIEDYLSKIEGVDEDDEEFDNTDSSLTLEEYKRAERKKIRWIIQIENLEPQSQDVVTCLFTEIWCSVFPRILPHGSRDQQ